jgi:TatD DNase family protein
VIRFFDAHSHLPDASPPGLRVICGTWEGDWEAVLAHARSAAQVIPMLGLHPWFAGEASAEWASKLESLLRTQPAGVGECGLDSAREDPDQATQEAAFRLQLRLAHGLHRPLAIHVVRAWGRTIDLLREEGVPPAGAMVHAFAGSPETASTLQSMGVLLSFSGAFLRPERSRLRESLRAVGAGQLLLESDGTADLGQVLAGAAELRGVTVASLAAQTWENGHRCFRELLA